MRTIHVAGIRGLRGQPGINPGEEITEDDLAQFFGNDGEVVGVRINGSNCWIEFADVNGAEVALLKDGTESGGHNLRVSRSKTPIRSNGYAAGRAKQQAALAAKQSPAGAATAAGAPMGTSMAAAAQQLHQSATRAPPRRCPPPRSSTPSTPRSTRPSTRRESREPSSPRSLPRPSRRPPPRRPPLPRRRSCAGRARGCRRRRRRGAFRRRRGRERGEPGERPVDARPRRKIHGAGVRGVRHRGGGGGGVGEGWVVHRGEIRGGERELERGGVEERHAAVDVKNREEKREPTRIRDRAPTDVHAPRRWYTTRSRGAATLVRASRRVERHAALETLARRRLPSSSRNPRRRSRQKSVASFWFASKTMR